MAKANVILKAARLGILISGRGSNLAALAGAVDEGRIPNAGIAIVISDNANAAGLGKATERGIETQVIERRGRKRKEHDREIVAASLLPAFPGLDAQRQALEHGAKSSGCTVHLVDETLDGGPIIAQRVVPVFDDDTVASLSARILTEEHGLYPEAVTLVLTQLRESNLD